MRLPGIEYNLNVPSLGRHDVMGPVRTANAKAAIGETISGTVEQVLAIQVKRQAHIQDRENSLNLSMKDAEWKRTHLSKDFYAPDEIPEDIHVNRTEFNVNEMGEMVETPRDRIPAHEVHPRLYEKFINSTIQAYGSRFSSKEQGADWIAKMKDVSLEKVAHLVMASAKAQRAYGIKQTVEDSERALNAGNYELAAEIIGSNTDIESSVVKDALRNIWRRQESDRYDKLLVAANNYAQAEPEVQDLTVSAIQDSLTYLSDPDYEKEGGMLIPSVAQGFASQLRQSLGVIASHNAHLRKEYEASIKHQVDAATEAAKKGQRLPVVTETHLREEVAKFDPNRAIDYQLATTFSDLPLKVVENHPRKDWNALAQAQSQRVAQASGEGSYDFTPSPAAEPHMKLVGEMEEKYNIPKNVLARMLNQESRFNPNAVGPQTKFGRAQGIAQIMMQFHPGAGDPLNPNEAIPYAAKYLREMYDRFGSWSLALAAYNAGPENVVKHGGIPPFAETQNYVKAIYGVEELATAYDAKQAAQFTDMIKGLHKDVGQDAMGVFDRFWPGKIGSIDFDDMEKTLAVFKARKAIMPFIRNQWGESGPTPGIELDTIQEALRTRGTDFQLKLAETVNEGFGDDAYDFYKQLRVNSKEADAFTLIGTAMKEGDKTSAIAIQKGAEFMEKNPGFISKVKDELQTKVREKIGLAFDDPSYIAAVEASVTGVYAWYTKGEPGLVVNDAALARAFQAVTGGMDEVPGGGFVESPWRGAPPGTFEDLVIDIHPGQLANGIGYTGAQIYSLIQSGDIHYMRTGKRGEYALVDRIAGGRIDADDGSPYILSLGPDTPRHEKSRSLRNAQKVRDVIGTDVKKKYTLRVSEQGVKPAHFGRKK
jgi:hypothetical protein